MVEKMALVDVSINENFIELITFSTAGMSYADPDVPPAYLPVDADDEALGQAVWKALKASKILPGKEFMKIFNSGVVQKNIKEREALAMEKYGYKTRKAYWQKMESCWITHVDNKLKISPQRHKRMDDYEHISDAEIYLPETASDAELGAALREGFRRCINAK